jgi:hypothetical protein
MFLVKMSPSSSDHGKARAEIRHHEIDQMVLGKTVANEPAIDKKIILVI